MAIKGARGAFHVSDCALNDGGTGCDCADLDLAEYVHHGAVTPFVTGAGRLGWFINHMGRECFVEAEDFPSSALAALATAANLPSAHDLVAVLANSDRVHLNDAREAVIDEFKAQAAMESIAGN